MAQSAKTAPQPITPVVHEDDFFISVGEGPAVELQRHLAMKLAESSLGADTSALQPPAYPDTLEPLIRTASRLLGPALLVATVGMLAALAF
jgi:hypothetical protein